MDLEGNKIWENRKNAYPPTHGNGGSPIIADGKLVLTCDGGDAPCTLALDLATGGEVWRTNRNVVADKTFSFCTPQLITSKGVSQIISPGSNIVQSLSPQDGKVLWFVRYDGYSVVPRPIYSGGTLFVCTGFNTPKLLAIDPNGSGDVTDTHVKWTYGTSVPATPSIVCVKDQIVMASDKGIASGVDVQTGKEVWRRRLGGDYSASPTTSGDRVYFQSEAGECVVLKIGETAEEISRNKLPGRIFASYSVIDQDLLVRSEQGIYRVGKP
jgi:outer membrane protein assembly factor BamB